MGEIVVNAPALGGGLQALLMAPDITPGDGPSYETCKAIYSFHPLGAKLTEIPIRLAQSKPRTITIPNSPEDRIKKQFDKQWLADGCDKHLFNLHRLKRVYGVSAIALLTEGVDSATPLKYDELWKQTIAFNVLDPLNVAGSLTGNLDPNAPGFLKTGAIAVNGKNYDRSRSIVALNEEPIFLEWTSSGFGYVGRSVFQRTLYPLKSFIETMVADAMVARKAGVIVAKMEQPGSIVDKVGQVLFGIKRDVVKEAATNQVISISIKEAIESLNLQNVNGALDASRNHIKEDIAAGAGMPAILINSETYAEGFGEGTEDAKAVADFITTVRDDMGPSYAWMDQIVMWRAWNPEFFKAIQADFPEDYGKMTWTQAIYQWMNSFTASWPSLLTEPDSKKAEVEDVRLKAIIAMVEVLLPEMDPLNRANVIRWAADNFNDFKLLFDTPLVLDYEALEEYEPPVPVQEEKPSPPFSSHDADGEVVGALKVLARHRRTGVAA
jgi:hypothetical protein